MKFISFTRFPQERHPFFNGQAIQRYVCEWITVSVQCAKRNAKVFQRKFGGADYGGSMEVQTADGFVMYGRWIPSTAPDPPSASTAMVRFCPL